IFSCIVFSVRSYSLKDGMLMIHHLGWSKNFSLSKLTKVEYNPDATRGSIRIFGIGGVFGFIGYFRNSILGSYHAYAADRKNTVVLDFSGTEVVITPEEPEEFVKSVKHLQT